jgi:hypothetical protein
MTRWPHERRRPRCEHAACTSKRGRGYSVSAVSWPQAAKLKQAKLIPAKLKAARVELKLSDFVRRISPKISSRRLRIHLLGNKQVKG